MFRKLLLLGLLAFPAAAQAEWKEASSKHFLVYGEESEAALRDTAVELEKFDFLLRNASGRTSVKDSMKIRVFVMPGMDAIRRTMATAPEGVAGYYTADVRGPIALTLSMGTGGGGRGELEAREVLLHELTHHFMLQYFPGTYPAWYTEGFADYYGGTKFKPDDIVELGHPIRNRYYSLRGMGWLPMEKLLTARDYDDVKSRLDMMYAEGWLLVHYLANEKERSGQLGKYLAAVASGAPYGKAATDAFGDLKALDMELRRYSRYNQIPLLTIKLNGADPGSVAVRTLSDAESALITYDIRISSGILQSDASNFAQQLAAVATRFPGDPYALRLLTEAQRLAGDTSGAVASVERWLAVAPGDPMAMAMKGLLLADALGASGSKDAAAWKNARNLILAANKASPGHPYILKAYHDSYLAAGELPPVAAQNAIIAALEIVPQDDWLRYQVASGFEKRGMIDEAIAVIKPLAFSFGEVSDETPKEKAAREKKEAKERLAGRPITEKPHEMLARLEKKRAGEQGEETAAAAVN